MSPLLFNICGKYIMRRALKDRYRRVSVGDWRISDLKYIDDTTLVAVDEEEFVEIINLVKSLSKELELYINASISKVKVIDQARCLPESDLLKEYEKIDSIVYLRSTIEANGQW